MSVIKESRVRIEADEAAARVAGFAPKPPLYAAGTPVNATGEHNYKVSRRKFEDLPSATMALKKLQNEIEQENRQDVFLPWNSLRFAPTMGIQLPMGFVLPTEEVAQRQSSSKIFPSQRAWGFLVTLPPDFRAQILNDGCHRKQWSGGGSARVRARSIRQQDQAYAIVSEEYAPLETDGLAQMVSKSSPPDAKGSVLYDGQRATMEALWHAPAALEGLAAGDFFKAGLRFTTADDGTSSIRAEAVLWRNLCLNLIIIDESIVRLGRVVHKGNLSATTDAVLQQVKAGLLAIGHFRDKWIKAEADEILKGTDPETVIGRLVHRGLVSVPGYSADELGRRLLTAYHEEPGYSRTSIVNAISRAAHSHDWSNIWAVESLERQASKVVAFQYKLDIPGEEEVEDRVKVFVRQVTGRSAEPVAPITLATESTQHVKGGLLEL